MLARFIEQILGLAPLGSADRHYGSVFKVGGNLGQERQQGIALLQQVGLVDHQDHRPVLRQQTDDRLVLGVVAPGFDDEQYDIHVVQRLRDAAVHRAIQRVGKLGLETRRIDENELRGFIGEDAGDPVPRRLCLA